MNQREKIDRLSHLSESDLRRKVIIPLLRRLGYSFVYETHGVAERGKDIVFTDTSKIGEAVIGAAIVSKEDLTGTVGDSRSSLRILDQVQMAFDEPFDHKNLIKRVSVDRCLVITSGRILPSATSSILERLAKYNLAKVVSFLDRDRLIELIDQSYAEYWHDGLLPQDFRGGIEVRTTDPMGVHAVEFRYTLTEAVIRNLSNGNVIADLTNRLSGVVAAPIWSPNAKKVALYSWYKRDGGAVVYRVTDSLMEFPQIVIEAPIVKEMQNLRWRTRADFEEPIIWLSDDVLLIKKTGRIQIIEEPPRWVDYDYDVEVEFGDETAQVLKITAVAVEWLSE